VKRFAAICVLDRKYKFGVLHKVGQVVKNMRAQPITLAIVFLLTTPAIKIGESTPEFTPLAFVADLAILDLPNPIYEPFDHCF